MAFEIPGKLDTTRRAGADLSAKQYQWVKLDSSGNLVVCDTDGERPYGILQDNPLSGVGATVMLDGISKLKAAAGNSIGDMVGTDNAGKAKAFVVGTDFGKFAPAQVLKDADAANGICSVAFSCLGISQISKVS